MKNKKGFTLIELILVTIILGILAAVAVPRVMGTVNRAEASAEDAVLDNLRANAESYAMEQLIDTGRKSYPLNPFDGAQVDGYREDVSDPSELNSGEWVFDGQYIFHKRNDESIWGWYYSSNDEYNDVDGAQADDRGGFGPRGLYDRTNGDDDDDFGGEGNTGYSGEPLEGNDLNNF